MKEGCLRGLTLRTRHESQIAGATRQEEGSSLFYYLYLSVHLSPITTTTTTTTQQFTQE